MMTPKNRTPLWDVPYQRNPFFTGREEVLNQLHQGLREENAVALSHPHPALVPTWDERGRWTFHQ